MKSSTPSCNSPNPLNSITSNHLVFNIFLNFFSFLCNSLFRYLSKYLKRRGYMNDVFKALNDETRRQILILLKEKDRSAGEIAEYFNISKPSISHHLELLRNADLITQEKKGQFVIYSINTSVLDDLLAWIIQFKPIQKLKK